MSDAVVLQRLILITLLAGVIGFERERHGRAAGFRTHILVGLGACLVMLTGMFLADTSVSGDFDPTRMGAQVVSGVGFLGAGTILRYRASIRGLTTAASLWVVAGLGLAVGAGFLWGALASTGIIILALFGFSRLERAMRRELYQVLAIETAVSPQSLARIRETLAQFDVEIRDLDIKPGADADTSQVEFQVKLLSDFNQQDLLESLKRLQGVRQAQWK